MGQKVSKDVPVVDVWNKIDAEGAVDAPPGGLAVSAKTGAGLGALRARLLSVAGWQAAPEGVYIARERHVQALREAQVHLEAAAGLLGGALPALDLLAEELRLTQGVLGEITGEFTPDDLLGVIFSRFCIGK